MKKDRGGWLSDMPEWLPPLLLVSAISLYILVGNVS
jgi:hypothetical protein